MHSEQATTLIVSVITACHWLCLLLTQSRGVTRPRAIPSFCKWFRELGFLWATGVLRGLRWDAQPLISKLGMWIMFQLQIIFTWEHCLLIKAIKITWSFCICKQFCIWALFTSATVALLKLVCKTANIRTNIMLTKANIKVAVSLYFPTLDTFFISRNCLSNIFLFNPCPRYFAKKMQERTAGSKTTKQTE